MESFTHFMPLVPFYTPWKQKTSRFPKFLDGIERDQIHKMGQKIQLLSITKQSTQASCFIACPQANFQAMAKG